MFIAGGAVAQIWLLANIMYCSLAIPYVWRACLIQGGSLYSHPLWIVSPDDIHPVSATSCKSLT